MERAYCFLQREVSSHSVRVSKTRAVRKLWDSGLARLLWDSGLARLWDSGLARLSSSVLLNIRKQIRYITCLYKDASHEPKAHFCPLRSSYFFMIFLDTWGDIYRKKYPLSSNSLSTTEKAGSLLFPISGWDFMFF